MLIGEPPSKGRRKRLISNFQQLTIKCDQPRNKMPAQGFPDRLFAALHKDRWSDPPQI